MKCVFILVLIYCLVRINVQLECFRFCQYRINMTNDFRSTEYCSNKITMGMVCSIYVNFDYKKQYIDIIEDSHPQYPPNFSTKTQILSFLESTIDFNHNHMYHNFTHHCSLDTYCTKRFLLNTIEQYRLQSYDVFIQQLRDLLRLNSLPAIPLPSIRCFNKKYAIENCLDGRCYAHKTPYATNIRRGCALRSFDLSSLFFITIRNLNQWIEFNFSFECYWSLCNNDSLVNDIHNLIKNIIYSSMTTLKTTRVNYTNKPIKLRTTKHSNIENSNAGHCAFSILLLYISPLFSLVNKFLY